MKYILILLLTACTQTEYINKPPEPFDFSTSVYNQCQTLEPYTRANYQKDRSGNSVIDVVTE